MGDHVVQRGSACSLHVRSKCNSSLGHLPINGMLKLLQDTCAYLVSHLHAHEILLSKSLQRELTYWHLIKWPMVGTENTHAACVGRSSA